MATSTREHPPTERAPKRLNQMEGKRLLYDLSTAETRLAEMCGLLRRAQLDALVGNHYGESEFDGLVAQYRAARQTADAALGRWTRWRIAQRHTAAGHVRQGGVPACAA